jgi:hypothetical protein
MNKISVTGSILCFSILCAAAEPKYGPATLPLASDNSYLRSAAAPDFWSLASFYVPQYNDYSCSAASVSMALNALINARRSRNDAEENIVQENLLSETYSFDWKGLAGDAGSGGKHGVTLTQLETAARESLANRNVKNFKVSSVETTTEDPAALASFRQALAENELNPQDIMLLHFAQDAATGAKGGPYPHVSPVGAYNKSRHLVLIFDVDRKWYEPYWAPDAVVLKAMATKTAAFGYGGYVILSIEK